MTGIPDSIIYILLVTMHNHLVKLASRNYDRYVTLLQQDNMILYCDIFLYIERIYWANKTSIARSNVVSRLDVQCLMANISVAPPGVVKEKVVDVFFVVKLLFVFMGIL